MNKNKELELLLLEKEKRNRLAKKEKSKKSADDSFLDTAADAGLGVAQGLTSGFADEGFGAIAGLYKKATGDERSYDDIYEEYRNNARERISIGRERSPFISFVADIAGGMANPASKVLKGGLLGKQALDIALNVIGESEREMSDVSGLAGDVGVGLATGAALKGAGKAIGKGADAIFSDPKAQRAKFLGFNAESFRKAPRGSNIDPDEIVTEYKDRGYFDKVDGEYPTREYVLGKINKDLRSDISAKKRFFNQILDRNKKNKAFITEKEMEEMVQLGIPVKEIPSELVINTLKRNTGGVNLKDISNIYENYLDARLNKIYNRNTDPKSVVKAADKYRKLLKDRLKKNRSFSSFDKIRSDFDEAGRKVFEKSQDLNDDQTADALVAAAYSTAMREYVNDVFQNVIEERSKKGLARLNKDIQRGLVTGDALKRATSKERISAGNFGLPVVTPVGVGAKATETVLGGDSGLLMRANIGDKIEDIAEKAPESLGRSFIRSSSSAAGGTEDNSNMFREPQSVNLPEELIKMKIPRSSAGIMENRELVEMKVAQQAPQMLDHIQYVFDNEPETLPDVLPVIVQMLPQIFERDKYNRIDGKIIDPKMKQLAEKDTMDDDGLTNTEKMLIIDNLNKTGEFPL